jgi:hypothetical protein
VSPFAFLAQASSTDPTLPEESLDPVTFALAKAGTLLVDLADQAMKLALFLAEEERGRSLAASLSRRAELGRQTGRKLVLFVDPSGDSAMTQVNDAILALDGIAVDVEYTSELAGDVKVKNQIARARLAITTTGSAIDDARHAISASA